MARIATALTSAGLIWAGTALMAQDTAGLIPQDRLTPPRSEAGRTVQQAADAQGIRTQMVYARSTVGQAAPVGQLQSAVEQPTVTLPGGNGAVWVMVLVLVAAIALWLRFGGSGVLLARAPVDAPPLAAAPDHWHVDLSDRTRNATDLLRLIAAMADRRAALVRLLRHCLLRAGEECQTRFARADTEREAFGRVPAVWRSHQALGLLLHSAELAHYGGRAVDDAGFDQALAVGRDVLLGRVRNG